jgi:probable sporulation protein (polysaccharide deacetylase family)
MNRQTGKLVAAGVIWAFFLYAAVNSDPIDGYVSVIKRETSVDQSAQPAGQDDPLRRQVLEWKQQKDEKPIDAKLDPAWKAAVPGYNGRLVDVEASIRQMRSTGMTTPDQLVYKEVPPSVTLEQLGPNPVYRGNPKKPAICFMINVAWGNEYLEPMLKTLDRYKIKTTFFLDGSWVKRNPELAKEIAKHGHEIGNHAYSHPDMSAIGSQRIREEIGRTQKVIEDAIGIRPTLFAPPSGAFNQQVVDIAANEFQMKTIMWTADTIDWQNPPVSTVIERVRKKMDNGVLVLMHPTASSSSALEQLIKMAKAEGIAPMTVSEVISSKRLDVP